MLFRSRVPAEPAPKTVDPGPSPFDPTWYGNHAGVDGGEGYDGYRARGSDAALSPCPLFSPAWYRARYPDVAVSGAEPLAHYTEHGWREGRDPSPLFSTSDWLRRHPDSAEAGLDPLSSFLRSDPATVSPHPRLRAFDFQRPDLAVVIAFAGDLGALDFVLWSLERSRGTIPTTVYLVDGATGDMRAVLDDLAARKEAPQFAIQRLHEPGQPGFAGLVNAGLWRAMSARSHTHIALLEQTVLTPEGLFGALVDLWVPLAAPVLNLARTEQAVPIDFDIYTTREPLAAVEAAAVRRRAIIPGSVSLSDSIDTGLVLFQAGALEVAGLLPVEASPGPDALSSLTGELVAAGLGGGVIARHLYAHRLEQSSALPAVYRRTVQGGGVPNGFDASPSAVGAAAASAAGDRAGLRQWTGDADTLLRAHAQRVSALTAASAKVERDLSNRLSRISGAVADRATPLTGYIAGDEVVFGETAVPPALADPPAWRTAYGKLHHAMLAALVAREVHSFDTALGLQPLLAVLAGLMQHEPPVLVLTMDTDPITGDEKDGYVQRVIAIDRAIESRSRIYLKMVASRAGRPALRCLQDDLWRLEIAHGCELGDAVVETLLRLGAPIYSQSLVGIDPPLLRRLLPLRTGPFIMDMHGAVPEEFVLYDNHYMAQKYRRYESWAAAEADIVVCVTDAMAEHFVEKLAIPRERMIVCPIFMHAATARLSERDYSDRPRVIYAGGTQRWQMVPEMAALVADTALAVDWVLLTPDTEGMERALHRAGMTDIGSISLRSASQTEVFATYARCDFGVLLREEDVVNRVACPTKLIEYLRFGVIPVLHSPEVGDFVALGMKWVAAEDFRAGRLPDPDERALMAETNYAVFQKLTERSKAGLMRIGGAVSAERPARSATPLLRTTA